MGIVPGGGGTQYLADRVGRHRALEIVLGADLFDAETAERYGWVNRALPAAELDVFVDRLEFWAGGFQVEAPAPKPGSTRSYLTHLGSGDFLRITAVGRDLSLPGSFALSEVQVRDQFPQRFLSLPDPDPDLPVDERIGALGGTFRYPFPYGYSCVGEVEHSSGPITPGTSVFAFHPHQNRFVVGEDDVVPLPPGTDPRTATLLPSSLRTAVMESTVPTREPPMRTSLPRTSAAALGTSALSV